ncbi:hypothetical protein BAUCODRAFT_25735 [Baudoinia panamericana UAMH 10762]|uniref:Shelterin complex subunit TPP1/Est3 domain-containing protein n=1 Tax=Baudoinia panamericana (strain UAMH 10762) TaxID=717646 RepID=M2MSU2_BAUPA|nr:uncharacterized protein BAUCODRAFT_25735 [Baudoinia panamericana UAMH 10762]EMC94573.1 hypothetical protein BAUCODRAFT_25735 [Baudoinia panamericana UAMH 10762]
MAGSLTEWLAPFIVAELQAVLAWSKALRGAPKIKNDPDGRFSDDGSNFKSIVLAHTTTSDRKVQLISVDSVGPCKVSLSDGRHSIRCELSEQAVKALEVEMGEKLTQETRGDVFSIDDITVISTPYGPLHGLVQLHVGNVHYQYHLRKKQGEPSLISQHEDIVRHLREIERIRGHTLANREEASEDDNHFAQSAGPAFEKQSGSVKETQASTSQVGRRKRPRVPSLARDGFEVERGINLASPLPPNQSLKVTAVQPMAAQGAALLSLLGVGKPKMAAQGETRHVDASGQPESFSQSVTLQHQSTPSPRIPRVPYGRRRVPFVQQRLLERSDSWYPSPPGQQFPKPSVPIDLLKDWNNQVQPDASPATKAQSPATMLGTPAKRKAEEPESREADASSLRSSSEGEQFSGSQWPQSQSPPKRSMLPPDSTVESGLFGQQRARPSHHIGPPSLKTIPSPGNLTRLSPTTPQPTSPKLQSLPVRSPMKHPLAPKPLPPSSALGAVVRSTQYAEDRDDMELDVPRPLVDPAIVQRQRRSEFMKLAQRRRWLQANCMCRKGSAIRDDEICAVYRRLHANDSNVTRAAFGDAITDAFPQLRDQKALGLDLTPTSSAARPQPALYAGNKLDGAQDAGDATSNHSSCAPTPLSDAKDHISIHGDCAGPSDRTTSSRSNANSVVQPPRGTSNQQPFQAMFAHDSRDRYDRAEPEHFVQPPTSFAFSDFFRAWQDVKPRGSFARRCPKPARQSQQSINVLGWDIG